MQIKAEFVDIFVFMNSEFGYFYLKLLMSCWKMFLKLF